METGRDNTPGSRTPYYSPVFSGGSLHTVSPRSQREGGDSGSGATSRSLGLKKSPLTPSQFERKVAIDARDLTSSRFEELRSSQADLHQRLSNSKKDESDDEDIGYQILVTPVVARAIASVKQRSLASDSGDKAKPRRIFNYDGPPVRPDDDEESSAASAQTLQNTESQHAMRRASQERATPRFAPRTTIQDRQPPRSAPRRNSPDRMQPRTGPKASPQTPARARGSKLPGGLATSFEVRSPSDLLREAEGELPKSPTSYEVTPNPLYNASPPRSPRNTSQVRQLDSNSFEEAAKQSSTTDQPPGESEGASSGIGSRSTSGALQAKESQAGEGMRMTHRRTFSVDMDNGQPQTVALDANNAQRSANLGTSPPKVSKEFAKFHAHEEAAPSPAGSVIILDNISPTDGSHKTWQAPDYHFPELVPPSAFSFRQPKAAAERWAGRPQHPAITKLSPRANADNSAAASKAAAQTRPDSLPEIVPEEGMISPSDTSLASSPDRTEYKDGVNSPNTAINKQVAATPWLSKVQEFISSPSSGGSVKSEAAARSRLSPRVLDPTPAPSRLAPGLREEVPSSGFGSPLTVSESSAAKYPSPVQRSDTEKSWSIAANFSEGDDEGQARSNAAPGPEVLGKVYLTSEPHFSPAYSSRMTGGLNSKPANPKRGSWRWTALAAFFFAFFLAASAWTLQKACSPQPLASCLANPASRSAAFDRFSAFAEKPDGTSHASESLWNMQQLRRTLGQRASGLGSSAMALLGFRKAPPHVELEHSQCVGANCTGDAEQLTTALVPYAEWYIAVRGRTASALQCHVGEDGELACLSKAFISSIGATVERVIALAGTQHYTGDQALALAPSRLQYYWALGQVSEWAHLGQHLSLEDKSGSKDEPKKKQPSEGDAAGAQQATRKDADQADAADSGVGVPMHKAVQSSQAESAAVPKEELVVPMAETKEKKVPKKEVVPKDEPMPESEPVLKSHKPAGKAPEEGASGPDSTVAELAPAHTQTQSLAETAEQPFTDAREEKGTAWSFADLMVVSVLGLVGAGLVPAAIYGIWEGAQTDDHEEELVYNVTLSPDSKPALDLNEQDLAAEEDADEGRRKTPMACPSSERKEPMTTWLASKLTPNRLTKVNTPPSKLKFREMRDRTVVTADGKQVGDLAPGAHHPADDAYFTPATTAKTTRKTLSSAAKAMTAKTISRTTRSRKETVPDEPEIIESKPTVRRSARRAARA